MADEILTAMVPPAGAPSAIGYVRNTAAGVPYKTDTDGLVYVRSQDVAEMQGYGYTNATITQVPAGSDGTTLDQGWATAT